jgi:Flp pilus assembly protein TadD
MQFIKNNWAVLCVVLVVGTVAYGVTHMRTNTNPPAIPAITAQEPVASSSQPVVTTSTPAAVKNFPINPADTIASWNFKGSYTGDDAFVAKANADIAHLKSLLGTGQYDDYDLYLGIGNDANLLGDGANAYKNFNISISIHPNKGLAYNNLGALMENIGAYHTAADAYAKAVAVQPDLYRTAQLDFMARRFPANQ